LLLTIFIHIYIVKPALTRGLKLMTVEATGQVPTLTSPKSGPEFNARGTDAQRNTERYRNRKNHFTRPVNTQAA